MKHYIIKVKNIQGLISKIVNQEKEDFSKLASVEPSVVGLKAYNMRGIRADDKCIGCGICTPCLSNG